MTPPKAIKVPDAGLAPGADERVELDSDRVDTMLGIAGAAALGWRVIEKCKGSAKKSHWLYVGPDESIYHNKSTAVRAAKQPTPSETSIMPIDTAHARPVTEVADKQTEPATPATVLAPSPSTGVASSSGGSHVDTSLEAMRSELIKHKTLYEEGLITAEHFEAKRRQIIGLP